MISLKTPLFQILGLPHKHLNNMCTGGSGLTLSGTGYVL